MIQCEKRKAVIEARQELHSAEMDLAARKELDAEIQDGDDFESVNWYEYKVFGKERKLANCNIDMNFCNESLGLTADGDPFVSNFYFERTEHWDVVPKENDNF